jgi:hypothetical protein
MTEKKSPERVCALGAKPCIAGGGPDTPMAGAQGGDTHSIRAAHVPVSSSAGGGVSHGVRFITSWVRSLNRAHVEQQ